MKQALLTILVVFATVASLAVLLWVEPFQQANRALDWVFDGAPSWTQVKTLVRDERLHELTSGEHPVHSFSVLAKQWAGHPGSRRFVFLGNSQMQTMSLAAGEGRPQPGEKTYFDHLVSRFAGRNAQFYRLAAGGLSYPEALWYVLYLSTVPELKPDAVFLQINYQSFWQGGIRDGMTELLNRGEFQERIQQEIERGQPYSDTFREAMEKLRRPRPGPKVAAGGEDGESGGGGAESQPAAAESGDSSGGFGPIWEARTRRILERNSSGFAGRNRQKVQFYDLLYRIRLYVFRLKPSAARSITGARLVQSRATLEALAEQCRQTNVKLVLFLAPQNPKVNLFRTEQDRESYIGFARDLARRYNLPFYDFEGAVPEASWGRYYNSPDPLHLGRAGHREFGEVLAPAVEGILTGK